MKRTTLSIAPSLLKTVREIAHNEKVTMKKVLNDLLELGLKSRVQFESNKAKKSLQWHSQSMKPKVDYDDMDTVYKILDSKK